jgi:hypothetical protein
MARFIGFVQGSRGEASRLGGPSSGIRAQARGWNLGGTVYGGPVYGDAEFDEFRLYVDRGSNGSGDFHAFGFTVRETPDGPVAIIGKDVAELLRSHLSDPENADEYGSAHVPLSVRE